MEKPQIRDGQKKLWKFIDVKPDHREDEYICIQELTGIQVEPLNDGDTGWRKPARPETRVIRCRMTDDGTMKNVHEKRAPKPEA